MCLFRLKSLFPYAFAALQIAAWSWFTPATAQPLTLAAHPRLLLDSATLAAARAQASNNTPAWQVLKASCDSFIGGAVNYPTGATYPNLPTLGQGYQGSSYYPALMNEAMCYQVLRSSNPSAAATYGAKAVDILMKMSTPYTTDSGNRGENPCTDDGYVMRYFGTGFGLGYDWLYDLLTPVERTQVITASNRWIASFENPTGCSGFEYIHPQGNYYAGYFQAKVVIALATYDENSAAPAQWNDWLTNQFGKKVQPYYARHMTGGGWPEGFANYGYSATLNMSLPMREIKTATGQDLIHGAAPYTFPLDQASYIMAFTWPSLTYFDDRDTNHSNSDDQPPGTPVTALYQGVLGQLNYWGDARAPVLNQYLQQVSKANNTYHPADAYLVLISLASSAEVKPINALPLSYFAQGMGAVSARSDWTTNATWMSFRAAPYTNNPGSGEEYFDQGSLALVHGNTPLLINATGFVVHNPNGTASENDVYADNRGDFSPADENQGNRRPYNIFFVRNLSGGTLVERYGQGSSTLEDDSVRTATTFEDGHDYVYTQATHLEDIYRTFKAGAAVSSWTREVIFLRPNRFVVYDRTAEGGNYDQFMAWHFPALPVNGTTASGQNRLDVTYNGIYAGAMTTVLPLNSRLTNVSLYPNALPIKAYQVQVRPANSTASQQWLTVFDLSSSSAGVATASPVKVIQGAIVGVDLSATDGNYVVITNAGAAGTPLSGNLAYSVTDAVARHIITDLPPGTGYTVSTVNSGGVTRVTVVPGGPTLSSAHGVLDFIQTPTQATGGTPVPQFSFTTSNLTAAFTDQSTDIGGTISAHTWSFGDGSYSAATNPVHVYGSAGLYTVTETVTDSISRTSQTSSQIIAVSAARPTGNSPTSAFTSSSSGLTAAFVDTSTDSGGAISSYAWSFGDGSTETTKSPNHTYAAAATYSVTHTVTDGVSGKRSAITASVVITAPSSKTTQLLSNPGFETGQVAPWGMSEPSQMLCKKKSTTVCAGETSRTGRWFVQMKSKNILGQHLALAQAVTIPGGKTSAVLSYYLHIDTSKLSPGAHNAIVVKAVDSHGKVLATLDAINETHATNGYVRYSKSLNALIGKSFVLQFTSTWNAPQQTVFTLDDVAITVD